MNNIQLRNGFFAFALLSAGFALTACTDDIEGLNKVDEGAYEAVMRVDGMLLDAATNKNQSVIELRSDKHEAEVFFSLTQQPGKGVDVVIEVDPSYLETYNAEHGTEFPLFPTDGVTIEREGVLLLAPDETRSVGVGIALEGGEQLQQDKTYVVPLRATSRTEGITLSEKASHAVLLVKDLRGQSNTYKGPGAMKTVLYFEVNDTNPLNALEFVTESGKLFFDEVVLFSANINYDAEAGRVYVYNNPNVQFLLDNNEQFLQPLRKQGIKVILGILGNHDASGVAQLSELGCKQFAKDIADYCYAYNLDGVGFDDEYSNSPDLSNPLFTNWSYDAAAMLCYETKKAMPDKTVMVYYLGGINSRMPSVDGIEPAMFVDYAVADYGGAASPMTGMTLKDCSGMSIELNLGRGDTSESGARSKKNAGYGYYMYFALGHTNTLINDFDSYRWQVERIQPTCRGLYEEELLMPEYYYAKNDATRRPLP